MPRDEELMSEALVRIFENVVLTEEKSLQAGYFSDLSIAEMHTLTAIGPYEARTMTKTAEDLGIGACWNQIRDRDGQRLSASDEIKQILGIPSQYEVLCVVALGHKAENKAARTEREQKVQQRTHFERF